MKVMVSVCDLCRDDDPAATTPAVASHLIAMDARAPREVEVCAEHDVWLDGWLGGVATRPSVARQSGRWECPICGDSLRRGGATLHLYRHTALGKPPRQPTKCPECKFTSGDARGMSRHRQNTHGWDGLAAALELAERERRPIVNTGRKVAVSE